MTEAARKSRFTRAIFSCTLALVAGCGGSDPTYTVSANISGLAGSGLVLQVNGGSDLPVSSNGTYTFSGSLKKGSAYSVTVLTRPANPGQTCTVASGTGVVDGANVSAQVACVVDTFEVRAVVTGVAGSGVTLQLNAGSSLHLASDGTQAFSTRLQQGATYSVSVSSHPTNPFQECTVASPSGTMPAADVSLAVTCVNTYVLSGMVSGLSITRARTPLVLSEPGGGGQDASVNSDGAFQFAGRIPLGRTYNVTVKTAPANPDMNCVISDGAGTMPGSDVSAVRADCQRSVGKFAYIARFPYSVLGAAIAGDGTLSTIESLPLDFLPQSIAVDPSGQFLYVAPGFSLLGTGISGFRINSDTGRLISLGPKIMTTNGVNFLAVEPQGRFLFTSNYYGGTTSQGSVSVYAIDSQTGQLTETAGSPFTSVNNPYGIAFDATGRFLYTTGDRVRAFSIDQNTGFLTELASSPIANTSGSFRLTGTPDGRFIYVRGQSGITPFLKAFRTQADGSLQEFPVTVDLSEVDNEVAMDPKGRFIVFFARSAVSSAEFKVSVYAISPTDGTLSRMPSPDWVPGYPSFPIPAAFDPSGSWMYLMQARGTLGLTYGTRTFKVVGSGATGSLLEPVNASAYDSGDTRAIAIR